MCYDCGPLGLVVNTRLGEAAVEVRMRSHDAKPPSAALLALPSL